MIKDILKEVESLDRRIGALEHPTAEDEAESQLLGEEKGASTEAESLDELKARRDELLEQCRELTPADRVFLARHQERPRIDEYIQALFTDFFEQRGDRECSDDPSILAALPGTRAFPLP